MQRFVFALLAAAALVATRPLPVSAHGEHNLEPFFRLRGVTFLDVNFSDDELAINEEMAITGKFRLMESWPRTVHLPELAFLNVLVPGPRIAVTERRVNGEFIQNAFHIEPGRLYDFEIGIRGREPGEWHLHGLINLEGTGSLVAPGKKVTVTEEGGPPTYEVTLPATGETIDLETFGLARVYGWHLTFLALGIVWCFYWARKPVIARAMLLFNGATEDEVIDRGEQRFSRAFAGVLVAIVGGGLLATSWGAPMTIPNQVQDDWELPAIPHPSAVETENPKFGYDPISRTMSLRVTVTNPGDAPVRLHRFATAYLSFLAEDALEVWPVPEGSSPILQAEPAGPIAPGETRDLEILMQDAIWETDSFINYQQPQVTAAGLLIFIDAEPPAEGVERPVVMATSDRETLGVPWDRVVSVNEVFSTLKVQYGNIGG